MARVREPRPLAGVSALQRSLNANAPRKAISSSRTRQTPTPIILFTIAGLIVVALTFGGGGVRYGLANLVVQLAALGLLAFYQNAFFAFWKDAPIALRMLVAVSIAVPLLHLIPLPETVWTGLPGRALAAEARASVGALGWAPATLDSARTMVALSGLIAPLAVLAIGWSIRRDRLFLIGWVVAAFGLITLLIGIGQVSSPEAVTSFYPENPMRGVLFGTFANRNSTGLFLVCALTFAALLPAPRPHPIVIPARLAVCILLIIAIVLTRSRTALALALLPILMGCAQFAAAHFLGRSQAVSSPKNGLILGGTALAAVALIAGIVALAPGRLGDTLERFDSDGDPRSYIWEDATYASSRYWPLGSGMGTFDEVFQVDESLENMTQRRAGRAHNDYIEVAIEAGLPGLVVIAGWLALLGWMTLRAARSPQRWTAWSGSVILLAIALQSITDYPLRNQSMLAVGALALLMLARCSEPSASAQDHTP